MATTTDTEKKKKMGKEEAAYKERAKRASRLPPQGDGLQIGERAGLQEGDKNNVGARVV